MLEMPTPSTLKDILTSPSISLAGLKHDNVVDEMMVAITEDESPNSHITLPSTPMSPNPLPMTVTSDPPVSGPARGEMEDTAAAATNENVKTSDDTAAMPSTST